MKLFTSAIKGSLTMLLCGVFFLGEIHLLAAIAPLSQEQLDEQSEHSSVNEATKPGATREVSGDKMAKRRRLLYVKGETEPFTGKVIAYTSGLKTISKRGFKVVTTYVNGKEQGEVFSSPCEGGSKEEEERPTIDALIGKKIFIEDSFAGQSFTLFKSNKDYFVLWIRHGSGVPVIRSQKCKVRLDSDYQFAFRLDNREKNHEFMVSIKSKNEIKVYLNGVRVHMDGITKPNLKSSSSVSP
ncbi:MAG: hypothetical protein CMO74_02660 [Verrucomicrobiales bacterium]|nr:hypothetical protein [Verrucomicrobiales bacterium]|tara:strand:- start:26 stop:748 length:723 start_codon:yes stop_codon:yes gene_type:complete